MSSKVPSRYGSATRRYRLNPAYQLIRLSEAPRAVRDLVDRVGPEGDLVALLVPRRADTLPIKALSDDAARVLQGFHRPLTHASSRGGATGDLEAFLRKQLLDGVLEAEVGGRFVSGIDALAESARSEENGRRTAIQRLSERAIRLALDSGIQDVGELTGRLYFYNRIPDSRRWRARFPDEPALLAFLGLTLDGAWDGMPRGIEPMPTPSASRKDSSAFWRQWLNSKAPPILKSGATHKVYVSPGVDAMPQALRSVLESMPGSGASSTKIGRDVRGLLRPDKIVVYFAALADARRYGARISRQLDGQPCQGVPFSCQVGGTAMVSLGVDPPKLPQADDDRSASWRVWVAERLARAVLQARSSSQADPVRAVLAAAAASGIDPKRWLPNAENWDFQI